MIDLPLTRKPDLVRYTSETYFDAAVTSIAAGRA